MFNILAYFAWINDCSAETSFFDISDNAESKIFVGQLIPFDFYIRGIGK
jgi:hypothetical protein